MPAIVSYTLVGILFLALGIGLGFWLGQKRGRHDAAKSTDIKREYDDYREQVAEHFGATAGHFQELGKQVRQLYDHMATGADTLCEKGASAGSIDFSAAVALKPPVDYPQEEVEIIADVENDMSPEVLAEAGEQVAESSEATTEEVAADADAAEVTEEPGPDVTVAAVDDDDAAKRSYH